MQPPPALPVQRLQRKLKEAARKILRLRLEKEQLLELGNRLRAELGRHAGEPAQGLARDAVAPGNGGAAAKARGREGERENRGTLVEGCGVRSWHSVAWSETRVRDPAGWLHP